jgi:Tfp pilus assembly major pilin PilA
MKLKSYTGYHENGLSLVGFMFVIVIVALLAVLGMKVVPTVVEFMAVKKAIVNAKTAGTTAVEIQNAFDRQKSSNYIDSVNGKDLEITRTSDGFEVAVAYQKKIELVGPASLVIDYVTTTDNKPAKKAGQ